MVNVDTVYQRVLALANKEQRGYITPQEFNLLANQAQMDIFEQYFYDLNAFKRAPGNDTEHADIVNILDEKISGFENSQSVTRFDIDPPNEVYVYNLTEAIPDLHRIVNVRVYRQFMWRNVERVSQKEHRQNQLGPLTRPSPLRPTYTLKTPGEDLLLYFQHGGNIDITVDYIRTPRKVNWTYIVVGEKALANPSSADYRNFELHPSEETELVIKILALAGVTIQDDGLYQLASSEDTKNTTKKLK